MWIVITKGKLHIAYGKLRTFSYDQEGPANPIFDETFLNRSLFLEKRRQPLPTSPGQKGETL